jgi:hypothetical protein
MRRPLLRLGHRYRTTLMGRGLQVVLAMGIAVGATLASPGVASATDTGVRSCRSDAGHIDCFEITWAGGHGFHIYVGIDVYMSRQDAEALAAQPSSAFAYIRASDTGPDNTLFALRPTRIEAWDRGLAAEWDTRLYNSGGLPAERLDEDSWPDEGDEVYALIKLYDARTGTYRTWETNIVNEYFDLYT